MFGDYSRDLLRSGIIEAKAGNGSLARRYLDRALYMSSDHDVMAEAWFWLSQLATSKTEKRKALENCLANDLQHARARRALAVLDGKLRPDEIVNPDALPPAPDTVRTEEAQRFLCPRCGGRMAYAPDGRSLRCEYCARNEALQPGGRSANDEDFIVAMATARAHRSPLRERVMHCEGCGAEFVLTSTQLSFTCAYCGSPHVISLQRSDELMAPDGIVPHTFDQKHARDVLTDWLEDLKIEPERNPEMPRGLYLPTWSFMLGGGIDYTGVMSTSEDSEGQRGGPRPAEVRDRYPVMLTATVAGSRKPSAPFVRLIPTYDMKSVQPYQAAYLADWPAELYDVPMAEASLEARGQTYAQLKRDLPGLVAPLRLLSTSSAHLSIESFRLDLLPAWITDIWHDGRSHIVLMNGQNGITRSDLEQRIVRRSSSLWEWLADVVGEDH
jgi:predicted RNA-binding Zn-ribbon protein involved in translation (DUF1610 family)